MSQTNNITASQKLRRACAGVMAAGLLSAGINAQAATLNLTLFDTPDIVSGFIDVTYSAATSTFGANGFAEELDDDGSIPAEAITNGTFNLDATIDAAGSLAGGSLTIGGTVATLGFNSGTLLTGDLTAFGFEPAGGDPLEFTFDVTGGDAAALYGGVGAVGGVIMGATDFGGSFDVDWSNTGSGVANVAPVPLPAALWLFGAGLMGLIGVGRRRAKA